MGRHQVGVTLNTSTLMKSIIWLLPFFLLSLAATRDSLIQQQQKLSELAAAGNGLIKLDSNIFDLLLSPQRTWSASVQFTALDKRRRCAPCRSVLSLFLILFTIPGNSIPHGTRSRKLGLPCQRESVIVTSSRPSILTMHKLCSRR